MLGLEAAWPARSQAVIGDFMLSRFEGFTGHDWADLDGLTANYEGDDNA